MRPVTSPRLRGEVGIFAHARRSRVRGGASDKPGAAVHNPKEAPHPDPLPASGARGNPRAVFQPMPDSTHALSRERLPRTGAWCPCPDPDACTTVTLPRAPGADHSNLFYAASDGYFQEPAGAFQ